MPTITATTKKNLVLVSGRAHPALADAVAKELGTELVPAETRTFANGKFTPATATAFEGVTPSSCNPTVPLSTSG